MTSMVQLRLRLLTLVSLMFYCFWFTGNLFALELPEKHDLDQREYRHFTLDNGLKVILVSDPKVNKSGAAMDIAVGSLSDPKAHQGLAHFLEHMLFLGTKKYPTEGEYSRFLKSRGGYSNAFTAGNHTNYHFMIHHEAFEGALDRFAQFFIAPLFNPEFATREKQAVHNEHQKNLLNDDWRQYHLLNRFFDPEHPAHHFSTGDAETLKQVDQTILKSFYERYYSANQMALALASSKSLDWMEQQVKAKFSSVVNRDVKKITYPQDFLPQTKSFRIINVKPVKDLRQLQLTFALPALDEHFRSQPATIIGAVIGHEGKGSLLSHLKAEGLATSLSAGGYNNTPNYASFNVEVTLTPKGLENVKKVTELCFSTFALLKTEPYPQTLFDELKARQQLEKVFTQRGEGTGLCMQLSEYLNRYPMEWAENFHFSLDQPDEKVYRSILERLQPENCITMIIDKSLAVDSRENIYGTEYSYREDPEWFATMKAAKPHSDIRLPEPNPFLPEKAKPLAQAPTLILNQPGVELYYSQDLEFRRPKATLIYRFRPDSSFFTLKNQTLLDLSIQCLNEQLNEYAYPASLAGVDLSLHREDEGIKLILSGYSDSLPKLLDIALKEIQQLHLSQERFDSLKEKAWRQLQNFEKEAAWQHARLIAKQYRELQSYLPREKMEILKLAQFNDIKSFIAEQLWKAHHIEALAHGDLYSDSAIELTKNLIGTLNIAPLPEEKTYRQSYLDQKEPLQHQHSEQLQTNNACYRMDILLGPDDLRLRMLAQVIDNFMSEPFYSEMRTRQQLGYIVWSGAFSDKLNHYLTFIIQSGTHQAKQVEEKAKTFLPKLIELAQNMGDEEFGTLKKAIKEKLLEKYTTISGKASELFDLTFDEKANYELKDQLLEALSALKKSEMASALQNAFDPKKEVSLTLLLEANTTESVSHARPDVANFKSTHPYRSPER